MNNNETAREKQGKKPTDKFIINRQAFGKLAPVFYFPLVYLYLELFLKLTLSAEVGGSFKYLVMFSLGYGLISGAFVSFFKSGKARFSLYAFLTATECLLFAIEYFCHLSYGNFMGISILAESTADVVGSYSSTIGSIIAGNVFRIILLFLPLVVFFVFAKKLSASRPPKAAHRTGVLLCGLALTACGIITALLSSGGAISDKEYMTDKFDYTNSTYRFGLINSTYTDGAYLIFGTPDMQNNRTKAGMCKSLEKLGESIYAYNRMNIDFNSPALAEAGEPLKGMHMYFSEQKGSRKNAYTGMFEGKNLIIIVAESFCDKVIDPVKTPTLYMMAHSGFVFENYYQPVWGVSTSDGEYSVLMGNIPKSGVNSMVRSKDNNNYFTMANTLGRKGYLTLAFHNNSYTYYDRNLTHENLGYSKWIALGNGLEVTRTWPESDLEMIQLTTDYYLNSATPFHVYYLTVSGHPAYSYGGNAMAKKNWEVYADVPMSDTLRAYYSSNYELERALTELISRLEAAGELDDTVIAISGDHYPYGLADGFGGINTQDYLSELFGENYDRNFELFRNRLIIYNSAFARTNTVNITKPCYSPDILPTLLNLFGCEYDSRLLAGRDILADGEGLVIFRNYSWISDRGRYNSQTGTYTPNEGYEYDEEYSAKIMQIVKDRTAYSRYVLENDYYGVLFNEQNTGE